MHSASAYAQRADSGIAELLESLLETSEIDLMEIVGRVPSRFLSGLSDYAALLERLPSGLVHADAIWLVADPPVGLQPLAKGSAWYATGRTLMCVLPGHSDMLLELVEDLVHYAHFASRTRACCASRPELKAALQQEVADPERTSELALLLGVAPAGLITLQGTRARHDLAAMTDRTFHPQLKLHDSLRPDVARTRARTLRSRC